MSIMELWLKNIANSEMTEITYSKGIKKFLEFHNVTLENIANEWECMHACGTKLLKSKLLKPIPL